jgi:hypothetical protein
MIINSVGKVALSKVAPFVSVVGSAYGFGKTCIQVYNATSPSKATVAGVKGVVINCTPPGIKYRFEFIKIKNIIDKILHY